MQQYTQAQRDAVVEMLRALLDVVQAHGANGVPAGEMYVRLMPGGMTVQQFNQCMACLVRFGHVTRSNNKYYFVDKL